MIAANELRIGNWVNDNMPFDNYFQIGELADSTARPKGGNLRGYDELNPIPVTPEILLKAGFVEKEDWFYKRNFFLGYISTDNHFQTEYKMAGVEGDWKLLNIKYLHQLQNLYFALTGQELNIQL